MRKSSTVRAAASLLLAAAAVTGVANTAIAAPAPQASSLGAEAAKPSCTELKKIFDVLSTSNNVAEVKKSFDRWIGILEDAKPTVPKDHQAMYAKYIANVKAMRAELNAANPSAALNKIHKFAKPLADALKNCKY
ncbi:hypothetical protein ABR737_16955 [Streptomyces sp. Edi2]|uniref:hypothetical protein n=1 Tax=Streptomyces sp. Edi2 TaxID=3162528 RepID=UPI0033058CF7